MPMDLKRSEIKDKIEESIKSLQKQGHVEHAKEAKRFFELQEDFDSKFPELAEQMIQDYKKGLPIPPRFEPGDDEDIADNLKLYTDPDTKRARAAYIIVEMLDPNNPQARNLLKDEIKALEETNKEIRMMEILRSSDTEINKKFVNAIGALKAQGHHEHAEAAERLFNLEKDLDSKFSKFSEQLIQDRKKGLPILSRFDSDDDYDIADNTEDKKRARAAYIIVEMLDPNNPQARNLLKNEIKALEETNKEMRMMEILHSSDTEVNKEFVNAIGALKVQGHHEHAEAAERLFNLNQNFEMKFPEFTEQLIQDREKGPPILSRFDSDDDYDIADNTEDKKRARAAYIIVEMLDPNNPQAKKLLKDEIKALEETNKEIRMTDISHGPSELEIKARKQLDILSEHTDNQNLLTNLKRGVDTAKSLIDGFISDYTQGPEVKKQKSFTEKVQTQKRQHSKNDDEFPNR